LKYLRVLGTWYSGIYDDVGTALITNVPVKELTINVRTINPFVPD
jgi:hypothetical protein